MAHLPLALLLLTLAHMGPTWAHQPPTTLHFYFHDVEHGPETSVAVVAKPENASVWDFGTFVVVDEPLSLGPDRRLGLVGRAQGMYSVASKSSRVLFMTMAFSFTRGRFSGSSFSVVGRYNVDDVVREFPIVGGTGAFRMARGYAIVKRYKYSGTKDENTAEYNVTILH